MKTVPAWAAILLLTACSSQHDRADPSPNNAATISRAPVTEARQVTQDEEPQAVPPAPVAVANGPLPATAGTQPSPQTSYRAIGTEPFWAVTVTGSVATLERPDKAPKRFAIAREDDGRTVRYLADGFAMTVTEGPCSDGMSDAVWADRVSLSFGEGALKGCGGARDDPEAGTP